MERVAGWVEFCLREAVVVVAGAVALHAERHRLPGDPNFPPRENDARAAGVVALAAVSLVGLGVGRHVICGMLPRRRKPVPAHRTGKRV